MESLTLVIHFEQPTTSRSNLSVVDLLHGYFIFPGAETNTPLIITNSPNKGTQGNAIIKYPECTNNRIVVSGWNLDKQNNVLYVIIPTITSTGWNFEEVLSSRTLQEIRCSLNDLGYTIYDMRLLTSKMGDIIWKYQPLQDEFYDEIGKDIIDLHASDNRKLIFNQQGNASSKYRAVFKLVSENEEHHRKIESFVRNSPALINAAPKDFTINASSHTATVTISNKQHAQKISNTIRDYGFECILLDVVPLKTEAKYKIVASLAGISCAACASSIYNASKQNDFIVDAVINVVTKSGVFISDRMDDEALKLLSQSIEDCGYNFTMIGEPTLIEHSVVKEQSRVVVLRVDGMYCNKCPENILRTLEKYGGTELIVSETITLNHPYIRFSYQPDIDKGVTIRNIIKELLNSVSSNESSNINIAIVEEVSINEHLKSIEERETLKILKRLCFTAIVTIPCFIFGVVGMTLLPKSSKFKQWLDEPIWIGNVSRNVWILLILSTPVYFFVDDLFHRKAIKEVRSLWKQRNSWKRRIFKFGSMSLLMSLGTSVAYFASTIMLVLSAFTSHKQDHKGYNMTYYDSVVFLTFFLLIGRLLESISKAKAAAAISRLGTLKQKTATVVEKVDDNYINDKAIDVKYLDRGEYIKIAPGESPAIDGIIVEGESLFDESSLTGESIPVLRIKGDQIFAGSINVGAGAVISRLSTVNANSLLDQIISSVYDGQLKRAPIERLADILTGYFVPLITSIALFTWFVWMILGFSGVLPQHYNDSEVGGWVLWSLEFAIAVFVIACPCGIGLAAPTALFVGAGLVARYGIIAKGGNTAFQAGSKVSVICFDKTGTLTKGTELKIISYSIHPHAHIANIAIQVSHDLASNSKHPLSIALEKLITSSHSENLGEAKVMHSVEVPGRGIKGDIVITYTNKSIWDKLQPSKVILGNEKFMEENNCHLNSKQLKMLAEWKNQGRSVLITAITCPSFFKSDRFFPVLFTAAADEIRPEAKDVIKALNKDSISCWMISGDNEITAKAVAKELGIKNVLADVLPEEKAKAISWIRQYSSNRAFKPVIAMVGDGVNDAPALAAADVGIAMASGSDLAVISSDFVLLAPTNTMCSLLVLLQLSKKVFQRVKINFAWALVYNMIGVPIAAGVLYPYKQYRLSPVWASAAMALSSLSVVLSSLALRFYKPSNVPKSSVTFMTKHRPPAIQQAFP